MTRSPVRVAVVAYTEYPVDGRVRFEAEALAEQGYEVHAIAVRPGAGASTEQIGKVRLHEVPLPIRRGGKARYAYQYVMFLLLSTAILLRLHLRMHFRVIHVHSLPDFQIFCAAPLKALGVPIILDMHEAMPEIFAARFPVNKRSLWFRATFVLERVSGRFADHIVTANDGIRSTLISRGMPAARITAVYNSGDALTNPVSPDLLRIQLGLPPGKLVVHAGGINQERDLETVIRAVSLLPPELDVHLAIAGQGDSGYIKSLQELASQCGIPDRVTFVGSLSLANARCLMSMSSVGLVSLTRNPLTELAWPTRIIEFANLKKPLLVADLRFLHGVLGDGAKYYTPGDARSLEDELKALMTTDDKAAKCVSQAENICSRFGTRQMLRRLGEVYENVL